MYYALKHPSAKKILPFEKDVVKVFKSNLSNYGRRRIQKALQAKGKHVSQYMIAKILQKHNLEAKHGRKKLSRNIYTDPTYKTENLIKHADSNLRIYSADFTIMKCKDRELIVSGVIDVNTRMIVGYSFSENYKSDFVKQSFKDAFENYGVPDVVHTDRGSQYMGMSVHKFILDNGAKHSFSDPGKPNQNQYIESFWKTMKTEIGVYKRMSIEDLKKVITYYMHYYNNIRLHSSIGYIPPTRAMNTL